MRRVSYVFAAAAALVFLTHAVAFASAKQISGKEDAQSTQQHELRDAFLVKQGARGENVKIVQKLLAGLGYSVGAVDGVCGAKTVAAIKQFQLSNNLTADGVVGEATLAYLHRAEPMTSRSSRSILMRASAYSAYDPGNSNRTATGSFLRKGLVAVDPSVIPLGTRLFIPGYGDAIADDIGGAIKGNRIDLAFDSHAEALQFGRQDITVYIID